MNSIKLYRLTGNTSKHAPIQDIPLKTHFDSMNGDLILGIETSCDDTSLALVTRAGEVIAVATADQAEIHRAWGGVYPELASRAHVAAILPTLENVMSVSGARPQDIRAIGVTRGPGLMGSLLVGINTATAVGLGWGVPVLGVNHLRGHLRSVDLYSHNSTENTIKRVDYPAIVLLVSGGHTLLAYMEHSADICLLGATRDDSIGEAYDKIGRTLGLSYPAGPEMDRLACEGKPVLDMPRPMIRNGYEFSFSGLKTAAARMAMREDPPSRQDIAASFVAACTDVLLAKCARALEAYPARSLVAVGGVSASLQIREGITRLCDSFGVTACLAPRQWATDNGAMIALAGWDVLESCPAPIPDPGLPLTSL